MDTLQSKFTHSRWWGWCWYWKLTNNFATFPPPPTSPRWEVYWKPCWSTTSTLPNKLGLSWAKLSTNLNWNWISLHLIFVELNQKQKILLTILSVYLNSHCLPWLATIAIQSHSLLSLVGPSHFQPTQNKQVRPTPKSIIKCIFVCVASTQLNNISAVTYPLFTKL